MALLALGTVSVPRGSDTPEQELQYIINHSGATHIIFETEELYLKYSELEKLAPMQKY